MSASRDPLNELLALPTQENGDRSERATTSSSFRRTIFTATYSPPANFYVPISPSHSRKTKSALICFRGGVSFFARQW